ncbi:hypothetical protein KP509_22G021800 [Ceratopteris richardii]|uniref:Uncharacterized protein n=1 Tax=Ceratopteris richardii TaxID=49495 RepID=A0A8T2S478_CERRI|nr:hypothetical protein KP509_22G021800 [Ceratopteris richardii]
MIESGGEIDAPFRGLFPLSHNVGAACKELINYALVDAFTDVPFKGNPAGVCILSTWRKSHWLQQIASELNVNMTAFLVKKEVLEPKCNYTVEGASSLEEKAHDSLIHAYDIRWFTRTSEVSLCGHATLASAYLLFGSGIVEGEVIGLHPKEGGVLYARKVNKASGDGFLVELNFPILTIHEYYPDGTEFFPNTFRSCQAVSTYKTSANDFLVVLPSEECVRTLRPSIDEMRENGDFRGLIVTGQGSCGYDFVSRFFAPKVGVDEVRTQFVGKHIVH